MTEQRRFSLDKAPFIRRADNLKPLSVGSTSVIMRDFIISLVPLIIFAWVKNGLLPYLNDNPALRPSFLEMLYPLLFILIGGFFSYALEALYYSLFYKLRGDELLTKLSTSYAVIPGLLLGMILPHNTPIWTLFIGCLFATVIAKLLFGGFGHNIFNPALIGYLFVIVAYLGVIQDRGGFLNLVEVDGVTSATPLGHFASNPGASIDELIAPYGSIWNLFVGLNPGSGAETSALLCILAFAYLTVRKVIDWRIPVVYIGTFFVLVYIIGAFNGYALDLRYALFHLFTGGLFFGAVFMATEPVTGPKTPNGRILYAISLGVLTVLFRFVGAFPEGVASAIITMNLFAILLDRICAKLRVSDNRTRIIVTYAVFALFMVLISVYSISKSVFKNNDKAAIAEIAEVTVYDNN
ncbi:MAG TPA: RnfABCDGE type electron transport complex subunit D [Bacilli bacterium]|nr:RnfABCDGE type electron transport complex subunit D [Bacilli bacterium]